MNKLIERQKGVSLFSFFLVLLLNGFYVQSQTANLVWVKQLGGSGFDICESIAVGASGHIYATGYFSNSVDFQLPSGTQTFTSEGNVDVFISKMDSLGKYVWVRQIGGSQGDYTYAMALDKHENVYTAMQSWNTLDMDPGPDTYNMTPVGNLDIFISKLDSNGNFVWAKQLGGKSRDEVKDIAVDASGNVYITGYFEGTADFDPGEGVHNLTAVGGDDIYICKLDAAGDFVWAKQIGSSKDESGYSIAVDASENVYITGFFKETVDFDPGTGTYQLTSEGKDDGFICKLNASGGFEWANRIGGTENDYVHSIAIDASGNVYAAGRFYAKADFDPGENTHYMTSHGGFDVFVLKYNNSGALLWAKQMGSQTHDYVRDIALDASGNVYTTGYFYLTADFDPGTDTYHMTSEGTHGDVFISKLDASGNFVWARQIAGPDEKSGTALALDASGSVYTAGYFKVTADFDPGPDNHMLTSAGNNDVFIHKMKQEMNTEVMENDFHSLLVAYPNPVNESLTVDLGELHENVAIHVLDINGRLVYNKSFINQQILHIRLAHLIPGVYLVNVIAGQKKASIKTILATQ